MPPIVEAAESSPAAAKECALIIRGYFSKSNNTRPQVQYNAAMLVRILSDNPGPTFTRNIDKKFIDTVKELLRFGRDPNVTQILMETLQNFSTDKQYDENLRPLIEMWKKEQIKMAKSYGSNVRSNHICHFSSLIQVKSAPPAQQTGASFDARGENYFARSHDINKQLPPPQELSSRIEEARTSAKLLTQVVQSTPPAELLQNDLIREFADRCQSASRSIQGYMKSQNPAPDNDTMLTLIETSEQLALAMSKHQRAVLQTRKLLGYGSGVENGTESTSSRDGSVSFVPPSGPTLFQRDAPESLPSPATLPHPVPSSGSRLNFFRRKPTTSGSSRPDSGEYPKAGGSGSPSIPSLEDTEDPFLDPVAKSSTPPLRNDSKLSADNYMIGVEPYHPGFGSGQAYPLTQNMGDEGGQAGGQAYGAQREQKSEGPIYRY